ncbi:MAG: hypothetical protein MPJ25_00385 [Pirellulales bacterium]|nr:hypothetical protein [Pirellulales bacterium]
MANGRAKGAAGYDNQYRGVGTAFQDQYAKAQERARAGKDYRRKVRQEEAKELDEIHGALVVPPSGQSGFDNSAQEAAKRWKKASGDAYKEFKLGRMSAEEFSALKNDYAGRAATFKSASENLKKATQDFDQKLQNGEISEATPTFIRDAFDSLRKGNGDFKIGEVDGQDVLEGTTAGGKKVSIPLNGLASGKNMLRFNEKIDNTKEKDAIVKDLDAFKKQIATSTGVSEQTLGWDQLSDRATEKVDNILQNDQTVMAIAADEYGIVPEYDENGKLVDYDLDAARQTVKDGILGELQNQLVPRQTQFRPIQQQRPTSADSKAANARAKSNRISNQLHNSLNKYLSGGQELDQAAVDEVFKQIGGNNIKGIKFNPKSGGFLGFGKSDASITITDKSGKKFDIPADAQGLINIALRTEFGTEVDKTQNQIGGDVKQSETDPLGIG